jgi:hypothetical protein
MFFFHFEKKKFTEEFRKPAQTAETSWKWTKIQGETLFYTFFVYLSCSWNWISPMMSLTSTQFFFPCYRKSVKQWIFTLIISLQYDITAVIKAENTAYILNFL